MSYLGIAILLVVKLVWEVAELYNAGHGVGVVGGKVSTPKLHGRHAHCQQNILLSAAHELVIGI